MPDRRQPARSAVGVERLPRRDSVEAIECVGEHHSVSLLVVFRIVGRARVADLVSTPVLARGQQALEV